VWFLGVTKHIFQRWVKRQKSKQLRLIQQNTLASPSAAAAVAQVKSVFLRDIKSEGKLKAFIEDLH
jgi:hypothetical protein